MTFENVAELREAGGIKPVDDSAEDDFYFCCASYEDRTMSATLSLSSAYRTRNAFVYVNEEFLKYGPSAARTTRAVEGLSNALSEKSGSVAVLHGSWLVPAVQVREFRRALSSRTDRGAVLKITIDATTFNREALIVCAAMLRRHFPQCRIRAVYVAPQEHGPWLSRGFRVVRNVVGFSGIHQSNQGTVVVVLSGFEGDRTIKTIEEHEPVRVYLGFGDPPTTPSFLERNVTEHKLVLDRTDVEEFRFPATTVEGCSAVLSRLIAPLVADRNVVVAPMSTKLSTLAAFTVAERYPEVQLSYCVPGEYNCREYSSGSSRVFIEEVL